MFALVVAGLSVAFLVVRLAPARMRLPIWCALVAAVVVPWATSVGHAHWDRVQWIPFLAPPDLRARDLATNVLLYVPFGLFFARTAVDRPRAVVVVAWALLLSVLTEASQVFSHGRFPTATDVVMNGLGAWAGVVVQRLGTSFSRRPSSLSVNK